MGNTRSSEGGKLEAPMNKRIEQNLIVDQRNQRSVIKVLLLGTGDSGKSTIFKQTRKYGGKDLPESERRSFVKPVFMNIISQMQEMISAAESLNLEYISTDQSLAAKSVASFQPSDLAHGLTDIMSDQLLTVWSSEVCQEIWRRRAEFQIFDSVEYFLKDDILSRISKEGVDYIPSFEDMLNCRFKTTGIIKETLKINNGIFQFVDVGGQRSERRKWLGCFDNVTSVLFVSSLSEYDQYLFEDQKTPRVQESLGVWTDIVNRPDFQHIAFLLFLNKWDLFQKKLLTVPFKVTEGEQKRNVDFKGAEPMEVMQDEQTNAITACAEYMENLYTESIDKTNREGGVTTHYSIATDTDNFEVVFSGCVQQIFKDALNGAGF